MFRYRGFVVLVLLLAVAGPALAGAGDGDRPPLAIRASKVLTMAGSPVTDGVILIRDGRIERVGPAESTPIPPGYRVIDGTDRWAVPGFIDLHCHIAGTDLNDSVYQVNPDLRVLDNVEPMNDALRNAVAGGVTTVLFIPGSGSNMGGFGALLKTHGRTPAEMMVRFPGALKIAQAGNPERVFQGDTGTGRMGMNWVIRKSIGDGKRYHEAWSAWERGERQERPAFDLRYDLMRGLFRREFPVAVHTQIFQVVQATMRILVDEFGLWVVIDHGTFDGYLNAAEFLKRGIPLCLGPRQFHYDRVFSQFLGVAASWHEGGMTDIAINTDAPVVPEHELPFQAAMAVRHGLPEEMAMRGLTIQPARMIGIDRRVGSLEAGKDADVVLWTGNPLDPRSHVTVAVINGEVAYDTARDRRRF